MQEAVRWANYPPHGKRGIGAERATAWGECLQGHVGEAQDHVLVVPLIESVTGGENIDALLNVAEVDLFFFGPAVASVRPSAAIMSWPRN